MSHLRREAQSERLEGQEDGGVASLPAVVIASVSGGKDSMALCLHLQEQGIEYRAVHMDTGWEYSGTDEYLREVLPRHIGPIEWVVPPRDFVGLCRTEGFPYAIDNGAWSAAQKQQEIDLERFRRVVDLLGEHADWVVAPDIVAGGQRSLDLSLEWLPRLRPLPVLIPVQDGMQLADLRPHVGGGVGLFLGGSTEWKLQTMPIWGQLAAEVGCHYHVARVNSRRRMSLASSCGAHSFDGSGVSRFAQALSTMDREFRQPSLKLWG